MADTLTPSVSELLNAADWEYVQTGTPADLRPFTIDGQQLAFFSATDGIGAHAWLTPQNQVVVSYEGTQLSRALANAAAPSFGTAQLLEDAAVAGGSLTPGEQDAAAFARVVQGAAQIQGIGAGDVFLTGHSLGGIQAEYAAQQTGLGGIAFEPTGIPRSATIAGDGRNFVDVVTYGDPVANYASDIAAEQPFAPAYVAGGAGALPHYGYVALIGNPADQAALATDAQPSALGPDGALLTAALYAGTPAALHLPEVQAQDLGVTLTEPGDTVGVIDPGTLGLGGDTIPQFIAATGASLSSPLPPVAGVNPTEPPYGGQAAVALAGLDLATLDPTVLGTLDTGIVGGLLGDGLADGALQTLLPSLETAPGWLTALDPGYGLPLLDALLPHQG